MCGIEGSGHCCKAACGNTAAPCGAVDCDAKTGACVYADAGITCGGTATCQGNTLTGASFCDGLGACRNRTLACQDGSFCDAVGQACCTGLFEGGALAVDNVQGKDVACCGFGGNASCQTLTRAMQLVDAAHARRTVITATVEGGAGDWSNAETYPIILGWGVELVAPGVRFNDPLGNAEIFDVNSYSINDTVDFASIVGSANQPVWVGMNVAGGESPDLSSIQVEALQTLYIANAIVASNGEMGTTAIHVMAGGSLKLGQNESGFETGLVDIGYGPNGGTGIACTTAGTQGCRISDVRLNGDTSVSFQGMRNVDLYLPDYSVVSLHSGPIFGVAPGDAGFERCPSKVDASNNSSAIVADGKVSLELWNATVQCIGGPGIALQSSPVGSPTLDLTASLFRNDFVGLWVQGGSATITTSAFIYNAIGVKQEGTGSIDLNGANTVACNSGQEIGQVGGGVSVLNTSTNDLDATDILWDNADAGGPDLFSCDALLTTCSCQVSACAEAGGSGEDMSAVETSTGTIDTTGPQFPGLACNRL